jgi:hypothetical protein
MGENSLSVTQLPRFYKVEVSFGFFSTLTFRFPCKNISQPLVIKAWRFLKVQCRRRFSMRQVVSSQCVVQTVPYRKVVALQLRIKAPVTEIHIIL